MIANCPVCGSPPYFEKVEPWPKGHGPAPWVIGCYRTAPVEHFVGSDGDTAAEARNAWAAEVAKALFNPHKPEASE
jgi:hypothetical protein